MPRYVCSGCGNERVTVLPSRPSLDDRYVVGYCASCNREPVINPKTGRFSPLVRSTSQLVRKDLWDPSILRERRERAAEQRLLDRYMKGTLSPEEAKQAHAILEQRFNRDPRFTSDR